jgi:predicted Zn-dependent peptidase
MNRILFSLLITVLLTAESSFAQKELPPAGGQPKDFTLPERTNITSENGLGLTLVPYGTLPKVTAYVVVRTGHINESAGEVWLSDLMGEWMKEGTTTRSGQTLARDAAKIGGSISVSVGDDRMFISGDALGEFAPELMKLLADVVRNPQFPESELPRLKNNLLRRLSVEKADPQTLALEQFRRALYGEHPYGRLLPTESDVNGFTANMVKQFYAENFGAARTHIYIAGVFDPSMVEETVRNAFAGWPRGSGPVVNLPAPVSKRVIHIVDRPGAAQSTIYLGLPVPDPSSADWIPLDVTNSLLGGSFASRITANIRENKGYTYSPYSSISARLRDAYWLQTADVSTDVTGASLKEIFYEINRLASTPPSSEELKGIQNYSAGIFVLRNSEPAMILNLVMFLDLHGLPDQFLTDYVRMIHQVTPEQVQRLTKKYLRSGDMTIVIAGDAKKIEKQVSPYGRIVR